MLICHYIFICKIINCINIKFKFKNNNFFVIKKFKILIQLNLDSNNSGE